MCKRPAIELMFATSNYGGRTPLSPHAQATIEKHIPNAKQLIYCQAPVSIQKRDASCITDVCSSEHLPEIEIISLLEEQIPKYKIRSDAMTKFGGYENQDWYIPFPTLPIPNDGLGLSKEQVRETLNYFSASTSSLSSSNDDYDEYVTFTAEDEHYTKFTKRLLHNNEDQLNSTSSVDCDNKTDFITSNPSNSSLGLENTFKVLESHLNYRKLSKHTAKFLDHIINYYKVNNKLMFMNADLQLLDNSNNDFHDSDFFELELEASRILHERLKCTLNQNSDRNNDVIVNSIENDNEVITHESGEYPQYIYHIAKGKDGRLYLRIVKSLSVDKVLSGERVSQMTKAYDDIEAVTRLLEEKEKDLELTVQIGKELLAQNNKLESKLVELEVNLKNINDNYQQLSHEVIQKNALISILTNDVDGTNTGCDTPTTPTSSSTKSINLEFLQKKISSLQDENVSLRRETLQLARDTDEIEDKEKRLMEEITNQLHSTNSQYDGLNLELERHKEENRLLHEQVTNLTLRLNETELRFHDLSTENEETMSVLSITKENQNMLANELVDFKERYQEVLSLLNETQEQLRNAKKRNQPTARTSLIPGLPTAQVESLQSELMETSMFSENSLDSGIALDRIGSGSTLNLGGFKKVFDTVKCVSKANTFNDPSMLHLGVMSMSSVSQPKMATLIQSTDSTNLYRTSSVPYTNSFSMESSMGARVYSRDSLTSDTESNYPAQAPSGCPGAPGAKDLEAALNRLTPAEVLARRAMLSHAPVGTYNYDETGTNLPLGIRTPDSIMSVGSYSMTGSGYSHHPQWRLPDKLQIVKPMEGSQTLRNWNRLATPTLSGLLEERPGVTIRGGRGLDDLGLQVYSLDDCEEDIEDHPGKRFPSSSCVYTFTNSTVMHPDDGTSIISSVPSSRMSSHNVSRQSSAPMTPRASLSRRNSCSTFSVNLGLASMLNERGIKAVTPSALNTPCGINYSPTVTPCNSPEGSPERTMSPEPQFLSGLLSSGADMLRRKLIGEVIESKQQKPLRPINKVMLSRLEKRALKSLKILEKVEHMGIESITPPNHPHLCPLPPLQGTSSLYSSRSASPMAQLTSLKKLGSLDSDEVLINRRTIKAILSKGLSNDNLRSLDLSSDDSDSSCISSLSTSLSSSTKKTLDKSVIHPTMKSATPTVVGSTTSTTNEVGSARMKQMQRQKSRRNIKNGHGGQRPDLGTVGGNNSNIIKNNINNNNNSKTSDKEQQPIGFIGSISSLLFGRKGGLL